MARKVGMPELNPVVVQRKQKLQEYERMSKESAEDEEIKPLSHEQFIKNYERAEQPKEEAPQGNVLNRTWDWLYQVGHEYKDVFLLGAVAAFIVFK